MTPSPMRALIAEDDSLIAAVIQNTLERAGFAVVGVAPDGTQAIELTRRLQPDVVLMDIEMPEMDGLTAARYIQEECPTPIVILTVYNDTERLQQAAAAGVGAYLLKPPRPDDLARAIIIARARFDDLMNLRRLNQELAAYDHLVSHDLKNPLSNIYTAAEFLLDAYPSLPDAEIERGLRGISKLAQRANSIVESLLLLGQPEALPITPLDMGSIIAAAQDSLSHMIAQTQGHIQGPAEWPVAYGHPDLVEQVWVNYLSNALKYAGTAPHVEIGATVADGQVRLWVRDSGRGLSSDKVTQLFKSYSRLPGGQASGHGLGLYLAQRIVERLGGQVGVESSGVAGEGSLFYFTLPDHP